MKKLWKVQFKVAVTDTTTIVKEKLIMQRNSENRNNSLIIERQILLMRLGPNCKERIMLNIKADNVIIKKWDQTKKVTT